MIKAAICTIQFLQGKILDVLRKSRDFENSIPWWRKKQGQKPTPELVIENNLPELLPSRVLDQDLVVKFDGENIECDKSQYGEVGGYHTLPNGVSFLGLYAGGDWETPVFFIVYWDGTKIRAYVPSDGNVYNKTTKMAYGNSEEDLPNPNPSAIMDEITRELVVG